MSGLRAFKPIELISVLATILGGAAPAAGQVEPGEAWAVAQDANQIKIVHGLGARIETVNLPAGTGPHLLSFSPSAQYAYVSGVVSGDVLVLRVRDRQVVATLDLGTAMTHEAKPSPDGRTVLVAQLATGVLFKVAADEAAESWTVVGSLNLQGLLGSALVRKGPVATVFRADGERAYVSLQNGDVAVVHVPSMSLLDRLTTDDNVATGLRRSRDGVTIFVSSRGSGGHFYRLDTATDTLTDLGYALAAIDVHDFELSENEARAYLTDRGGDALLVLDLRLTAGQPPPPTLIPLDSDRRTRPSEWRRGARKPDLRRPAVGGQARDRPGEPGRRDLRRPRGALGDRPASRRRAPRVRS